MDLRTIDRILWITAAVLASNLLVVLVARLSIARALGQVERRDRRRRGARWALVLLLAVCAGSVVLAPVEFSRLAAGACFALALASVGLAPGFQDSAVGELGVQRGWSARRFEQLEEWRLIGDHLRWKLAGEWVASDLAQGEHPRWIEKLRRVAPGRESRFNR